ncbi:CRAL-TRIO domain-containing protein [Scheffersomyces xylosifermentans]|uniref:CRAL-TRIO domain-containing protein n=1 Tax=Scheffersomyces xylosifermentans TaxID=1304137 RepID=UPI00315D92D0
MSDSKTEKDSYGELKATIKSTELTNEQASKLAKLIESIPSIVEKVTNNYDEIFGYRINVDSEEYVNIPVRNEILLKFLAADEYDLDLSTKRLIKTLNWRNKFQPLSAAFVETFDAELDKLGVITDLKPAAKENLQVVTWNLYGNLKSPKKLFEKFGDNADTPSSVKPGSQFLRWRIGLMEKAIQLLDFADPANNKLGQIHDYNNVSMFSIDPGMKAATKEIIEIFGDNYPELLSTKFFINVPILMAWVFTFFKTIGVISAATLKKFQVLNNGDLSEWFPKGSLPAAYSAEKSKAADSLFALDVASTIKVNEYGKVSLTKLWDKQVEEINDTVE